MKDLIEVTKTVLAMNFFEMCDHHYLSARDSSMIEACVRNPFSEASVEPTEQILYDVASHMLSEMAKEYPEAILVCHL